MAYNVTEEQLQELVQQGLVSVADSTERLAIDPAIVDQLVLEIDTGAIYRWHAAVWELVGSIAGGAGATNLGYTASTRALTSSSGTGVTLPEVVAAGNSGLVTGTDKTKLDGIAAGAQVNVGTDLAYTASSRLLASSTGSDATLPEVVAAGNSGLMTGTDKTKLNGIATGAQVNVGTDLAYTASSRLLASSTGADATLPEVVAAGNSGLMTGTDKTKLNGIETGATADQSGAEIVTAIDTQLGSTDWQGGGGGGGGDVVATSLTVNGLTRTKTVTVTGPASVIGEPGVTYHADLRTGDVTITAPDLPMAGDTLRGRLIATGLGTFTICGLSIVPGGGTAEYIAGASGVPATWRLGGVGP